MMVSVMCGVTATQHGLRAPTAQKVRSSLLRMMIRQELFYHVW